MWREAARQTTPAVTIVRFPPPAIQAPRTTTPPFSTTARGGGFAPYDVLATQGRGMAACWNPNSGRMHKGAVWYALFSTCWTFEPGPRRCRKCTMISSPYAPKCSNWSRGCLGTLDDFDEPMDETCTPGFPAYLEGQRAGALCHARKHGVPQERDAAKSTRPEGRPSDQQAPGKNRMVRFESGAPARDGGRNPRWDVAGPSGKGGIGKSWRHRELRSLWWRPGSQRPRTPPILTGRAPGPEGSRPPGRSGPCPGRATDIASSNGAVIDAPDGAPGESNAGGLLDDLASRDGAPGQAPDGPGGDSSLDDLGSEVQIIITAIGNQERWVLSQGRLEQQGCHFR